MRVYDILQHNPEEWCLFTCVENNEVDSGTGSNFREKISAVLILPIAMRCAYVNNISP